MTKQNLTSSPEKIRKALEQIPPHDASSEACVLGSMLLSEQAAKVAIKLLPETAFYVPRHRALFAVLKARIDAGHRIDERIAIADLKRAGKRYDDISWVEKLAFDTTTPSTVEEHALIVLDRMQERKALEVAAKILDDVQRGAGADIAETARQHIEEIATGATSNHEGASEVENEIESEISGKRYAVRWPWDYVSNLKALLPASITVICGSPGASKSLLLVQAMLHFYENRIPASVMQLEKTPAFHMRRALAMISETSQITNDTWCRSKPAEARAIYARHRKKLLALEQNRLIQTPGEHQTVNCEFLLRWITSEAERGCRVIGIDPISNMQGRDQRYLDQERFVHYAQRIVAKYQCSLILVTHPRTPQTGQEILPNLENVQGSKSFRQFVDTVLWLHSHPEDSDEITTPHGIVSQNFDRTLHALKVRLAGGANTKYAFTMDTRTLKHTELGKLDY